MLLLLLVLASIGRVAAAPGNCGADVLSAVSFSGGLYSYGQPLECAASPQRHWCLASLQSNLSSLNVFFSNEQPWGLCVPRSCNASDLMLFLSSAFPALPAPVGAYCWPDDPLYDKRVGWTVAGGIIVSLFLVLVTSVVAVTCLRERRDRVAEERKKASREENVALLGVNSDKGTLGAASSGAAASRASGSDWGGVLDLRNAVSELTAPVPPALRALDFFRVVSIGLVVLGHVLVFTLVFFANPRDIVADTASAPALLFVVAALGFRAVDTFFFLGALLVSYVVVRRIRASGARRLGGARAGLFLVAHRVLRVMPLYYTALLAWMFVAPMISGGPVAWHYAHEQDKCLSHWWANLLFVNNFVPAEYGNMCMGWSWYLAVDLQLFIVLGPVLLAVLVRLERMWVFWVAVAMPLCLGAMGYSAYFATQVGYMAGEYNTLVYSKPYARLVPFVVGIATGGMLAASPQHNSHHPSMWLVAAGHTLAALGLAYCSVAHLYLVVDNTLAGSYAALAAWSVSYSVLYAPVWSAVLAWLSFSCYHRLYPSLVQSVMEWQLWSVLARLGFGIYLFHPIVLHLREYNRVQLPSLTVVWIVDNFLAVFVCSVALAFLFYVTVEYPASAVVKRLLPSPKKD